MFLVDSYFYHFFSILSRTKEHREPLLLGMVLGHDPTTLGYDGLGFFTRSLRVRSKVLGHYT